MIEPLFAAVMVVAVLLFFGPGVLHTIRHSPKGSASDWWRIARLAALVVLFVVGLIALVR